MVTQPRIHCLGDVQEVSKIIVLAYVPAGSFTTLNIVIKTVMYIQEVSKIIVLAYICSRQQLHHTIKTGC